MTPGQHSAESSVLTPVLQARSGCSLGDAPDTVLLSEFLRVRSEPAALQSAVTAACGRSPQPPDMAQGSGPWPAAMGELVEGMLPRGHVLDMLGLRDEPRRLPAEPSAQPAALVPARSGVPGSSSHASRASDGPHDAGHALLQLLVVLARPGASRKRRKFELYTYVRGQLQMQSCLVTEIYHWPSGAAGVGLRAAHARSA